MFYPVYPYNYHLKSKTQIYPLLARYTISQLTGQLYLFMHNSFEYPHNFIHVIYKHLFIQKDKR